MVHLSSSLKSSASELLVTPIDTMLLSALLQDMGIQLHEYLEFILASIIISHVLSAADRNFVITDGHLIILCKFFQMRLPHVTDAQNFQCRWVLLQASIHHLPLPRSLPSLSPCLHHLHPDHPCIALQGHTTVWFLLVKTLAYFLTGNTSFLMKQRMLNFASFIT